MRRIETEVLVIGGGLAGLSAALEARRRGADVLLVCKRKPGRSGNTLVAACNLSAVFAGADSAGAFVRDTLSAGKDIGDPDLIEVLASRSEDAIEFLEEYGVRFVREESGRVVQAIPGHSRRRTVCTVRERLPQTAGGLSLTLPLLERAEAEGVRLQAGATAAQLLGTGDRIAGALAVGADGEPLSIRAGSVVLACGGGGRLYRRSNNTGEMTGDGFALAYLAGAELRDLEFVQFFPLMGISPLRVLLPTTVFGDGAVLRNRSGERFLAKAKPGGEKEVTRDDMSRAIFREVEEGRGVQGGVLLDLTGVSPAAVSSRYGALWSALGRHGCDPTAQPVVVGLTAHFCMGGMTIDCRGASTIRGLYGAGEVTGGIHGANRLGGNALTEAVVFGRIAGASAAEGARAPKGSLEDVCPEMGDEEDAAVRQEVRNLLWEGAGVVRSADSLRKGRERWEGAWSAFRTRPGNGANQVRWLENRNLLLVSRLILEAALLRTESRGAHYRSDYPDRDDRQWLGSIRAVRRAAADEPSFEFRRTKEAAGQ